MADSEVFPWDVPLPPERTVGWVIQAQGDEPLNLWLQPGAERLWEDARSAGKEPGQPVLFLQVGRGSPTWMGWGRILEPQERWRIYGVRTVCAERLDPPLPVVDSSVDRGAVSDTGDLWENRALGTALGLLRHRNRTPYGEVGARDLRLTDADLHQLVRAQPGLRRLGGSSPPHPVPPESAPDRPTALISHAAWTAPSMLDLQQAEKLVMDDLKRLFGDEVEFSSLKGTPDRFRGREYWVVEGSFWSDFVLKNFQYAVAADTGELAAKRVDRE
jgi:hypothetical protein